MLTKRPNYAIDVIGSNPLGSGFQTIVSCLTEELDKYCDRAETNLDFFIELKPPKIDVWVYTREQEAPILVVQPIMPYEIFPNVTPENSLYGYELTPISLGNKAVYGAPVTPGTYHLAFGTSQEGISEATDLSQILTSQGRIHTLTTGVDRPSSLMLMSISDRVITRGGVSTFESILLNKPTIIYRSEGDFTANHYFLQSCNMIYLATKEDIERGILDEPLSPPGTSVIDGLGPQRIVAEIFKRL